ncbi:hypothetical protein X798_01302 [Onchocerca flexuosa]|uniref:Plasmodium vivax Vir protein n=2 Tax=Onchocerca flexuosa TaxID=387005 RepID=A0A183HDT1_9BILA|nr:hypothetical protein X798_01302 [Onchocerca flexuosa]VDO43831.1 unnamed protein product [Onchocerca flexuosa]
MVTSSEDLRGYTEICPKFDNGSSCISNLKPNYKFAEKEFCLPIFSKFRFNKIQFIETREREREQKHEKYEEKCNISQPQDLRDSSNID